MPISEHQLYQQVLVLRCQSRSPGAFEELIRCYDTPLRFYVRRIMGEPDCVEDILQEVWLAVISAIPKLRHPAALSVWLYRIARDKAFYMLRQKKKFPGSLENDRDVPAVLESDEGQKFLPKDAARIHACLDKLSLNHREALVLRIVEQMTYEEVAKVLDCAVGTVRSRIYHAKRRLGDLIRRANDDER